MKIKIKLPSWQGIKNVKQKIKKYAFPINCILGIIGIVLLAYSTYLIINDYQEEKKGIRYQATITALSYQNDYYLGTVTYVVEDTLYEQKIKIKNKEITVNDKVEIKYDKNNPNHLIENNHFLQLLFLIPVSIICLKLSVDYLLEHFKGNKKTIFLKENGILIYADVDLVFINNKAKKKKGRLPYLIRLKYHNPTDGNIYTYESKNIYFDIKTIIEEKGVLRLTIYLNKENTYDYYIDIEVLLPKEEI